MFSESKVTPVMASARIQRWDVLLSAYNYIISDRPGREQANADALSRLTLPEAPKEVSVPAETILLLENLSSLPVSAEQIRLSTASDPILAKVKQLVQTGWSSGKDGSREELRPYHTRKLELSLEDGCILWGGGGGESGYTASFES